ncbi:hypothetical protein [Rhizobium sp. BK176]|uniref:hypothetical protein n=1 Tax=Rhizobium sp. BK176 TaxID=2587071 RepID=UPI002168E958|nr:hypothetical protein [Rhizobium sp. BK176]MCS4088505.1 hypothetical protein [Rhizobium sp. BK176]
MSDVNEIKTLEDRLDRRGIRDHVPMIAVVGSLMMLPCIPVFQNDLPVAAMALPLVPMLGVLLWVKKSRRWENAARRKIADHYYMELIKTKWTTPAGAEGIVIEVGERGYNVVLAFANGGKETYAVNQLTPVETKAA